MRYMTVGYYEKSQAKHQVLRRCRHQQINADAAASGHQRRQHKKLFLFDFVAKLPNVDESRRKIEERE